MISNVPLFLKNNDLLRALSRYGLLVSLIQKALLGYKFPRLKLVVCHQRQVFKVLKDADSDLKPFLNCIWLGLRQIFFGGGYKKDFSEKFSNCKILWLDRGNWPFIKAGRTIWMVFVVTIQYQSSGRRQNQSRFQIQHCGWVWVSLVLDWSSLLGCWWTTEVKPWISVIITVILAFSPFFQSVRCVWLKEYLRFDN